MKAKICVVGEKSSEKSEVLSPFVLDNFDDKYIQTMGTAVSKKRLSVKDPGGSGQMELNLTVWNILYNRGYRELMKEAYFYGARGALCVVDGTRKSGLDVIDDWASGLFEVNGNIAMAILVNTKGKSRDNVVEETEVAAKAKTYDAPYFYTSTKTGENVELAFHTLAERIVAERLQHKGVATKE